MLFFSTGQCTSCVCISTKKVNANQTLFRLQYLDFVTKSQTKAKRQRQECGPWSLVIALAPPCLPCWWKRNNRHKVLCTELRSRKWQLSLLLVLQTQRKSVSPRNQKYERFMSTLRFTTTQSLGNLVSMSVLLFSSRLMHPLSIPIKSKDRLRSTCQVFTRSALKSIATSIISIKYLLSAKWVKKEKENVSFIPGNWQPATSEDVYKHKTTVVPQYLLIDPQRVQKGKNNLLWLEGTWATRQLAPSLAGTNDQTNEYQNKIFISN